MKECYDVSDINKQLVLNLRDIGHTIRQIAEGKGSQRRVLCILHEVGPITQCELTQRLGIQPGSASEVLGRLEAAGLLFRTLSETDHRTMNVCLTEEGKAEAAEAYGQRAQRHKQMFSCISEEEKETLLSLLERINDSWDQQYREKTQKEIQRMWYRRK